MMKSKLFILVLFSTILFVSAGCTGKKEKKSYLDMEKERIEREERAKKMLTDTLCAKYRDTVLKQYFGKSYKLNADTIAKVFLMGCYICNEGTIDGFFKGTKGSYEYRMELEVNEENSKNWKIWRLFIKDASTGLYVFVIDVGEERTLDSYNKESNVSNNSASFNLSISEIEDMLQRQWNAENASSPVGAEDSNVFNVHLESVASNKVVVSYDLRSTYHGQKKFTHLNATLTPNSNGKWEVSKLAY